jgi:ribose 5-phosphate isomerase RpiB
MAIAANKVKGVFAGSCSDIYAAERLAKSGKVEAGEEQLAELGI